MSTSDRIDAPEREWREHSARSSSDNDNRLAAGRDEFGRLTAEKLPAGNPAVTPSTEKTFEAPQSSWFAELRRRLFDGPAEPPPSLPGSAPYVPRHPLLAVAYGLTSVLIAVTYGLGLNFVNPNLYQVAGEFSASTNEAMWLSAAYMAPNASLSLLLVKIRAQYGLRRFAELAIILFIVVNMLHLFANELETAVVARFFAGIAAAPMSTLSFLYLLECFPPDKKMTIGMPLAMINTALGTPLARLISPTLFDLGGWQPTYVLEVGLALISFALIYKLPLTSPPKAKVIGFMDVASYLFLAVGFGTLAIVLSMGRYYWWTEAPWLGWLGVISIASLACVVVIELNRKYPLLDIKWLLSPQMLHFAGVLILFRMLLSEQSSGVSGLFQQLGLLNEQLTGLYAVILGATIVGGLICAAVLKPGRESAIHAVSLILLAVGAYMDSQLTVMTRPYEMYVSQALVSIASALFLAPALAMGFVNALKMGTNYILSFLVVFLFTQNIGGQIGSALFSSFVIIREKFHSAAIVEHLVATDPLVAQRIAQLGAAHAKVLSDPILQHAQGTLLLAQQATQQAYALAYGDAFLVISIASALAAGFLILKTGWQHFSRAFADVPARPQQA